MTINVALGSSVFANPLDSQSPMIAAVPAWRLPKLTFECAIKRCFRFISYVGGDFRDASGGLLKRSSGQLEPPATQIRHGRLSEIAREALDESGSRNTHLIRETGNRPRMGRATMQ